MNDTYQRLRDKQQRFNLETMKWEREKAEKSKFEREERYLVFKLKDIKNVLNKTEYDILYLLADKMNRLRPIKDCVVVEDDWPEYELVWDMIEERMNE